MQAAAAKLAAIVEEAKEIIEAAKGYRIPEMTAEFTLVAVTRDRGEECLEITGHLRQLEPPEPMHVPYGGMVVEPRYRELFISGLWPVDTRLPVRRRTDTVRWAHMSRSTFPISITVETEWEMVRSVVSMEGRATRGA